MNTCQTKMSRANNSTVRGKNDEKDSGLLSSGPAQNDNTFHLLLSPVVLSSSDDDSDGHDGRDDDLAMAEPSISSLVKSYNAYINHQTERNVKSNDKEKECTDTSSLATTKPPTEFAALLETYLVTGQRSNNIENKYDENNKKKRARLRKQRRNRVLKYLMRHVRTFRPRPASASEMVSVPGETKDDTSPIRIRAASLQVTARLEVLTSLSREEISAARAVSVLKREIISVLSFVAWSLPPSSSSSPLSEFIDGVVAQKRYVAAVRPVVQSIYHAFELRIPACLGVDVGGYDNDKKMATRRQPPPIARPLPAIILQKLTSEVEKALKERGEAQKASAGLKKRRSDGGFVPYATLKSSTAGISLPSSRRRRSSNTLLTSKGISRHRSAGHFSSRSNVEHLYRAAEAPVHAKSTTEHEKKWRTISGEISVSGFVKGEQPRPTTDGEMCVSRGTNSHTHHMTTTMMTQPHSPVLPQSAPLRDARTTVEGTPMKSCTQETEMEHYHTLTPTGKKRNLIKSTHQTVVQQLCATPPRSKRRAVEETPTKPMVENLWSPPLSSLMADITSSSNTPAPLMLLRRRATLPHTVGRRENSRRRL